MAAAPAGRGGYLERLRFAEAVSRRRPTALSPGAHLAPWDGHVVRPGGVVMTEMQRYLAEEVAEDLADGIITRREALKRLGLMGITGAAASALLASFASPAAAGGGGGRPPRRG